MINILKLNLLNWYITRLFVKVYLYLNFYNISSIIWNDVFSYLMIIQCLIHLSSQAFFTINSWSLIFFYDLVSFYGVIRLLHSLFLDPYIDRLLHIKTALCMNAYIKFNVFTPVAIRSILIYAVFITLLYFLIIVE